MARKYKLAEKLLYNLHTTEENATTFPANLYDQYEVAFKLHLLTVILTNKV